MHEPQGRELASHRQPATCQERQALCRNVEGYAAGQPGGDYTRFGCVCALQGILALEKDAIYGIRAHAAGDNAGDPRPTSLAVGFNLQWSAS